MTGAILQRLYAEGNREDCLSRVNRVWNKIYDDGTLLSVVLEDVPEQLRDAVIAGVNKANPVCESPIERRILPHLIAQRYQFFDYEPLVLLPGEGLCLKPYKIAVVPQLPIGSYRVDFALAASRGGIVKFVIVECDGAEFHQDVHKDVKRDAELLRSRRVLDICVLTGSEIWNDPKAAAGQVAKAVIDSWSRRLS